MRSGRSPAARRARSARWAPGRPLRIAFGSCRVAAPHAPPWSMTKDEHGQGREIDALVALGGPDARRRPGHWPELLCCSAIRSTPTRCRPRRWSTSSGAATDRHGAPADQVADFEEYCHLYWEAWRHAAHPLAALDRPDGDDLRRPRRPRRLEHVGGVGPRDPHQAVVARADHRCVRLVLDLPAHRQPLAGGPAKGRAVRRGAGGRGRDGDPAGLRRAGGASAQRQPMELPPRPRRDPARRRRLERGAHAGPRGPGHARRGRVGVARRAARRRCGPPARRDVAAVPAGARACTTSRHGTRRSPAAHGGVAAARVAERMRQGLDLEHWAAFDRSFRRLPRSSPRWRRAGAGARRPRSSCSPGTSTTRTWRRRRRTEPRASWHRSSARRFATRFSKWERGM